MKTAIRILTLLLLASLFLAACNLPANGDPFAVGPTAWIDAPLNGVHLPLAPVTLVGHGYDNASVSQFEWSVNGSVVNTLSPSDANGKLFNNQTSWTPNAPGNYTVSLRVNGSGGWSGPVSAVVTIGEVDTPTLVPPADTPTLVPVPATQAATLSIPQATAHLNLNCHRSPDTSFESDGTLFKGTSARILATTPDKNWLQIENPQIKGNRCWILGASVETTGDLSNVPLIASPPTPTLTLQLRPRYTAVPNKIATAVPNPTAIPFYGHPTVSP